ncbi:tripartite tricarboxylate transporter substrate-binding protein [Rhizobium sp. RU20A]|uniref:tripartite tricarboxylate transporter substrate-binding protein n=1 Tax=Rhizobium sp. RU20A TaxID=1907412 RepID=UPI001FCECE8C|nr:tripartite tricarboxylate transporter substrate-binding protein [Rhizobium sp. RU20A]
MAPSAHLARRFLLNIIKYLTGNTTRDRAASVPDVPSIGEPVPGYESYTWNPLFARAGTPKEIVKS